MDVGFCAPCADGALRQGEILTEIFEHSVVLPCDEYSVGMEYPVHSKKHPYVIVLTQDCDLNQDYLARFTDDATFDDPDMEKKFRNSGDKYLLSHVLVCVAQSDTEIKHASDMNRGIMKRVQNNQNERFHHLGPWQIPGKKYNELDLYIDFKRIFSLPACSLYDSVYKKPERRLALVHKLNVLDISHRLSCFLSRVALP